MQAPSASLLFIYLLIGLWAAPGNAQVSILSLYLGTTPPVDQGNK